jgi:nitrous oxidase accessory protein
MGRTKWIVIFAIAILLFSSYNIKPQSLANASAASTPGPINSPPADALIVPDKYPTIQAAIGNASAGDTVFIKKGTYNETVYVDKSLSLIGEDNQKTIIRGVYNRYSEWPAIHVLADNVSISGLMIVGSEPGILIENSYAHVPSRCTITGNNFLNNSEGILAQGDSNELVETVKPSNHIISGNYFSGNAYGIYDSASNTTISGNEITGNHWVGIIIDAAVNVTVRENNISNNGISSSFGELKGGLDLRWWGPFYVYGNNITNNQGYGIQFGENCNNSTVHENNMAQNGVGINLLNFLIENDSEIGSGSMAYGNNVLDNSKQAFVEKVYRNSGFTLQNVTDVVSWDNGTVGNYWSDYQSRCPNAAEVDASGIGNAPYAIDENNTDYYPLMQQVDTSATAPTPTPAAGIPALTIATIAVVVLLVVLVSLLIYRAHRKIASG